MFRFRLLTPDRMLVDEQVVSVSAPTVDGEITILTHHAPLTALLKAGALKVTRDNGQHEEIAVSGGFVEMTTDGLSVLAETAERGEELELTAIEEAKRRAEEVMRKAIQQDDVSFAAAAAALQKELARYKVARRHHGEKHTPVSDRGRIKHKDNVA